jgi:hypothetical protein
MITDERLAILKMHALKVGGEELAELFDEIDSLKKTLNFQRELTDEQVYDAYIRGLQDAKKMQEKLREYEKRNPTPPRFHTPEDNGDQA